ncbi:hypothetical protein IE53DRAFT_377066 [Violaceomyces palustris]|uniref:Uncharacterized protein n=1 Tax=Violaceomyces palustris TaxID=1673888 RepID=A0ACD0P6S3_9BASI|nr:hypothetical protein IE53DRAFT_377066 [Violaceomyces palustris]
MFDEPLRQMNNSGRSEFDRLKAKLDEGKNIFIRHANQPTQETKSNDDSSIFLDSDLLLGENVELQVCLDSDHDPSTIDNLYMSDSIFFVTDMYQLTQHLQKAPSLEQNSLDPTLRLLSMFASKPDTHLVVIDNMNAKLGSSVRDALEASIGPASTETFYRTSQRNESFDPILHVSVQKTQTGIDALRKALSQGDEGGRDIEASHLWGIFSDSYSSSGIGSVQKALANSSRRESQPLGETTKLEYMCRHAFSEAVASVQKAKVELTTVEGFGTSLYDDASDSIRLARLEILGIDSSQPIRSDRCQEDPVEVSIEETRGKLVKLFRQKLAWWKILWKADDFRSELEQVCSGFGRHLETQLASAGGPIDALTERVQRLAITAYATAGASTAAIAYLTILGAYFPSSPLTEFHLDPSTALGIWALVAMLLAWRVQGRYAKVQRLFWEDWSRLSAGLEHDLQNWLKELQGIESALVRIKEARKW